MRTKWCYAACFLLASAIFYNTPLVQTTPRNYSPNQFRSGDIIFVNGKSIRSSVVRFLQMHNSEYSHVGVIVLNNESAFVIHADPQRGRVVKENLNEFLSPDKITGGAVYRANVVSEDIASIICDAAQSYVDKNILFNSTFDLKTTETLYCTELVWRAYLTAGINLRSENSKTVNDFIFPTELQNCAAIHSVISF